MYFNNLLLNIRDQNDVLLIFTLTRFSARDMFGRELTH